MRYNILLTIIIILFSCAACKKNIEQQKIVPLYKYVYEGMQLSAEDEEALVVLKSDSTLSNGMTPEMIDYFAPEIEKAYPTLDNLEESLGGILANASDYNLDLPQLKYNAVVLLGKNDNLVITNDYIFIALNHYLGANYDGYAPWPEYMRALKTPQQLPYDIVDILVATHYPFEVNDKSTVISRLLYEGALIIAKMYLVPNANLSDALGYDEEQLIWLDENRQNIWMKMVADKLLFDKIIYDKSQRIVEKLVAYAPSTNIIASNVPGRAGIYIGYWLAATYMEQNNVCLKDLLSSDFYNDERVLNRINLND